MSGIVIVKLHCSYKVLINMLIKDCHNFQVLFRKSIGDECNTRMYIILKETRISLQKRISFHYGRPFFSDKILRDGMQDGKDC
jgi:hypothetical protein